MMEANLKYFGANRDFSEMVLEYQSGYSVNEWAIYAEGMKMLEENRMVYSTELLKIHSTLKAMIRKVLAVQLLRLLS